MRATTLGGRNAFLNWRESPIVEHDARVSSAITLAVNPDEGGISRIDFYERAGERD